MIKKTPKQFLDTNVDIASLIALKRDGHALTVQQVQTLVQSITSQDMSDPQIGALVMAIYIQGLSDNERVSLTHAMRDSGRVMEWDLPGPVLDKHSTGGVGDCVSLILAPALAACGAYVPMVSGRGLGHTGGTLDKLESIDGYNVSPSSDIFSETVRDIGCAIIGQTDDIAPADRRLYAVRDVTATVSTPDLIVPSILSKKLAVGLDGLILDVKCGSGSFMTDIDQARDLAKILVDVSNGAGCPTTALITDMNEPLASAAGNAVEMQVVLNLLTGFDIDTRLWDVTIALGGDLLLLGGLAVTRGEGQTMIGDALTSGRAAEHFAKMVSKLGGPSNLLGNISKHIKSAPIVEEIYLEQDGFIQSVDTTSLGKVVVNLGGGRKIETDVIDPRVGLDWIRGVGMHVDTSQPVARIHAATENDLERARQRVKEAYSIGDKVPLEEPLIIERVG
jgi:thymidine phosphorylase